VSNSTARLGWLTWATAALYWSCVAAGAAEPPSTAHRAAEETATELEIVPVRDNVYMLASDTGNVTVQVGDEGVLLVDTLDGSLSEKLLRTVKSLSSKPIRWIINTSADPGYVGGNAAVANAGKAITSALLHYIGTSTGAAVLAHENAYGAMSSAKPAIPFEAWPTSTYSTSKSLFINGEAVRLLHMPAAHTDGDSIVLFRRSDVISVGGIMDFDHYPVIGDQRGGTLTGTIDALNKIIELAVPAHLEEGGTMIVPGRGRLCDQADLVEYRDMLTIIRDDVQEMIREGKSLKQIVAAKPTLGYDPRYGLSSGAWTNDRFVEAVYHELRQQKPGKSG
jgi:glyoxylase-like metal-dependent hydrolase (beta-lactamase superfamily II)